METYLYVRVGIYRSDTKLTCCQLSHQNVIFDDNNNLASNNFTVSSANQISCVSTVNSNYRCVLYKNVGTLVRSYQRYL